MEPALASRFRYVRSIYEHGQRALLSVCKFLFHDAALLSDVVVCARERLIFGF